MAYYDETPKKIYTKFIGSRKERRLEKKESLEFHVVLSFWFFLFFSFFFFCFAVHVTKISECFPQDSEDWLWLRLHAPLKNPPP